jgi:hypothetical protein
MARRGAEPDWDDEDDDRPRRRQRRSEPRSPSTATIAVGVAGGLLLAGCLVVGLIVAFSGGTERGADGKPLPPADMTLKGFVLQKPEGPTAVQVECELDTYHNFAFRRTADTHHSFRLVGHDPFASAHGYAPKDSEHGRKLYELLKDGGKKRVTVKLQRVGPDGSPLPADHADCFALVG